MAPSSAQENSFKKTQDVIVDTSNNVTRNTSNLEPNDQPSFSVHFVGGFRRPQVYFQFSSCFQKIPLMRTPAHIELFHVVNYLGATMSIP